MIRTIQCTNGETCYAEECTSAGMCMHQDQAGVSEIIITEPVRSILSEHQEGKLRGIYEPEEIA